MDEMPETTTYRLLSNRMFEVDIADGVADQMVEQTGADSRQEAVEERFTVRERQNVEPEQKLLGVEVKEVSEESEE